MKQNTVFACLYLQVENVNNLGVSAQNCAHFFWINKTESFIFVHSFVGTEHGTIQKAKNVFL